MTSQNQVTMAQTTNAVCNKYTNAQLVDAIRNILCALKEPNNQVTRQMLQPSLNVE